MQTHVLKIVCWSEVTLMAVRVSFTFIFIFEILAPQGLWLLNLFPPESTEKVAFSLYTQTVHILLFFFFIFYFCIKKLHLHLRHKKCWKTWRFVHVYMYFSYLHVLDLCSSQQRHTIYKSGFSSLSSAYINFVPIFPQFWHLPLVLVFSNLGWVESFELFLIPLQVWCWMKRVPFYITCSYSSYDASLHFFFHLLFVAAVEQVLLFSSLDVWISEPNWQKSCIVLAAPPSSASWTWCRFAGSCRIPSSGLLKCKYTHKISALINGSCFCSSLYSSMGFHFNNWALFHK